MICTTCNTPLTPESKGLDDIHCQECWERLCAEGWWKILKAIGSVIEGNKEE